MGVTMKKEAYEHYIDQDEDHQKQIASVLFDSKKHKKSISRLKFDVNRFESAYWSKPLNEETDRRLARGGDDSTKETETSTSSMNNNMTEVSETTSATATTTTTKAKGLLMPTDETAYWGEGEKESNGETNKTKMSRES
jgi:hypothetical protein